MEPNISLLRAFWLTILIAIEFSRFRVMYILNQKTITSGPARNSHTRWVYILIQKTFTLGPVNTWRKNITREKVRIHTPNL